MQSVIDAFEERVKEVDLYFCNLDLLYEPNVFLCDQVEEEKGHGVIDTVYKYRSKLDSDFLKILKANSFLLIYNLVESSITDGFLAIYRELENKNISYDKARGEFQEIWLNYHYNKVFDKHANFDSYQKTAKSLIELVLTQATIKLDRKAIGISGNLDADQIRLICDKHGVSKHVDSNCKGGVNLNLIKQMRNALAHGSLSFLECGRDYSETSIKEYKDEAVIFVRSILQNMKDYIDSGLYESGVHTA